MKGLGSQSPTLSSEQQEEMWAAQRPVLGTGNLSVPEQVLLKRRGPLPTP